MWLCTYLVPPHPRHRQQLYFGWPFSMAQAPQNNSSPLLSKTEGSAILVNVSRQLNGKCCSPQQHKAKSRTGTKGEASPPLPVHTHRDSSKACPGVPLPPSHSCQSRFEGLLPTATPVPWSLLEAIPQVPGSAPHLRFITYHSLCGNCMLHCRVCQTAWHRVTGWECVQHLITCPPLHRCRMLTSQ